MDNEINEILKTPPTEAELDEFFSNRDPAWHRAARGTYDAPLNWWITWIHLSMLSGAWGSEYKGGAQITQNRLNLTLEEILMRDDRNEIFLKVSEIMIRYQKAYFAGRVAGSFYVIGKGTKLLTKAFPPFVKKLNIIGNFGVVSFGAAILATAKGYTDAEDIVLSIMTGKAQRAPKIKTNVSDGNKSTTTKLMERYVMAIEDANDYNPAVPVSYSEWCAKNPELVEKVSFCQ